MYLCFYVWDEIMKIQWFDVLYIIIIWSPISLDNIFILVFLLFLCSRKVSRATHFSPEHSMVNNLRGAKGQWKWPSILDTPSSSKSLWLYDDEQKKLKKENRRRPPKKRRKSEAEKSLPGLFILFFPLSLDCRLFFILCILSKIPKKSYQNGGGLWCDLRQIPSVSVQLCILCKYSHYCCLFIYKDILLHQRGSILSQENAEKLSNFRQLQWAFFCQV